jgi:ABC-type branched-subunit amino acid transport system permease subunit
VLKAIRDDEWVARSLGKDVSRAHRQAFFVSGVFAGAAGVLYALQMTYLDPSIAGIDESVLILGMVIIGGSGNRVLGPLCGALVFVGLPEVLRLFELRNLGVDPSNVRLLIFGLFLVLIVHKRPRGLAGARGIN